MTDVTVRDATEDDVQGIRSVATGAWPTTYAGLLGPRTIERALEEWYDPETVEHRVAENHLLVADDDGVVVGFADAARVDAADLPEPARDGPDDLAELGAIYVPPSHQGEGIGSTLLDAVEERLAETGCGRLVARVLAGNEPALSFYDACGFERVAESDVELFGEAATEVVVETDL